MIFGSLGPALHSTPIALHFTALLYFHPFLVYAARLYFKCIFCIFG
jgi:hypothetical protein